MDEKIFVSIASYKDPELRFTLDNIFLKSQYPERIVVGLCQQHYPDQFIEPPYSNIKSINFDVIDSLGACWARYHAHQFYDGEPYFLQLDSHMDLVQNWDSIIIEQIKLAESLGSKKVLMGVYPPAYSLNSDGTRTMKPSAALSTMVKYDTEWPIGRGHKLITGPYPNSSPFVNAGLMFGHGSFYIDCPYDPEVYFVGEEILNTLKAYTHGYDLYNPCVPIGWHLYKNSAADDTRRWNVHWNPVEDEQRKVRWWTLRENSNQRVKKILNGEIPEVLGKVRTIKDYETYINRPVLAE